MTRAKILICSTSPLVILALLHDIAAYILANGHINVRMQIVRRLLPVERPWLDIKTIIPVPLKKLQLLLQLSWHLCPDLQVLASGHHLMAELIRRQSRHIPPLPWDHELCPCHPQARYHICRLSAGNLAISHICQGTYHHICEPTCSSNQVLAHLLLRLLHPCHLTEATKTGFPWPPILLCTVLRPF